MFNGIKSKIGKNKVIAGIYNRIKYPPISEQQFREDFDQFTMLCHSAQPRFLLQWNDRYPCLKDRTTETPFDHHYIYHVAWAARRIAKNNPKEHVDISSTLYFPAIVSAFIPVKYYDFRPAVLSLSNLKPGKADVTSLPFPDNSIHSLSCMHTVEHIGLGRYGDPLDPEGDLKAIHELIRVLESGGDLFFVVPVGEEAKIMFNAHRIYTYNQIIQYFESLSLQEFSLIPDTSSLPDFIENADPGLVNQCSYACGCFWFKKR